MTAALGLQRQAVLCTLHYAPMEQWARLGWDRKVPSAVSRRLCFTSMSPSLCRSQGWQSWTRSLSFLPNLKCPETPESPASQIPMVPTSPCGASSVMEVSNDPQALLDFRGLVSSDRLISRGHMFHAKTQSRILLRGCIIWRRKWRPAGKNSRTEKKRYI